MFYILLFLGWTTFTLVILPASLMALVELMARLGIIK